MLNHFNHAKVEAWKSLTDSERYWTGYLGRMADDGGFVKKWHYGSACIFLEKHHGMTEPKHRAHVYAIESLLVALTSLDKKIVFRALIQASSFLERLDRKEFFNNAFETAKARFERMVF